MGWQEAGAGLRSGVIALALAACAPTPPPSVPPQVEIAPILDRADAARDAGDFDAAIAAYQDAMAATPWNSRIRRVLAATYVDRAQAARQAGSLPRAESDLRAALLLEPDDPELRRNLAVILIERANLDLDDERAQLRRAEARALSPDAVPPGQASSARLERMLDLSFELLERGQVDAGIARLEDLRTEYPDSPPLDRLLAQAYVRKGGGSFARSDFDGAADAYAHAIALYAPHGSCDPAECARDQLELAYQNQIVALLEASRTRDARAALERAEAAGLDFPDLRAALPVVDFD